MAAEDLTIGAIDRILRKVSPGDGCWTWGGTILGDGYGQAWLGRQYRHRQAYAHRIVYELLVGPIPEGLQLDHLCRVRSCVRPDHLEPVTCQVNILRGFNRAALNARKVQCIRGHVMDDDNVYVAPSGGRRCRTCRRAERRRRRRKEAA